MLHTPAHKAIAAPVVNFNQFKIECLHCDGRWHEAGVLWTSAGYPRFNTEADALAAATAAYGTKHAELIRIRPVVISKPAFDVIVKRGNDLIFPRGNEHGDFSEPLWLASVNGGPQFHGRTPDEAAARCRVETLRRAPSIKVIVVDRTEEVRVVDCRTAEEARTFAREECRRSEAALVHISSLGVTKRGDMASTPEYERAKTRIGAFDFLTH